MANEFDDWRSKYDTMSSSEQVEYYNEIEELGLVTTVPFNKNNDIYW